MDTPVKVEQEIRDYHLLDKINTLYNAMTTEELKAAHRVIAIISDHLDKKHFGEKIEINVKALVKTFGELDEIGIEKLIHTTA